MNHENWNAVKIIIGTLGILIGILLFYAVEVKVSSWWLIATGLFLFVVGLALLSYALYLSVIGRFATEGDLFSSVIYHISHSVRLPCGDMLFILKQNVDYPTQVVIMPLREGFKKFVVLDSKYLVSRELGAKVIDGQLVKPLSSVQGCRG